MKIPQGTPLKILEYRDFHDIPRLILAGEQGVRFWILDSPFDDSVDEYSKEYSVFFVGNDLLESRRLLESWSGHSGGLSVGSIAVDKVCFDETRRKEFVCI
ncbi:hypothetical protein [Xanthomonas campestris]|uniref:hypothetical protein n=1 Tax=Xanthomonas campestris TaxID=339 RepID=UPI0012FD1B00|nr:hypothetical protein [Xanthomonas campestris]